MTRFHPRRERMPQCIRCGEFLSPDETVSGVGLCHRCKSEVQRAWSRIRA
jgi:hypothetical protein